MLEVIEFIQLNYIWFLIIGIVILLAVIGYYADKTNFWQGKVEDSKEKVEETDLKKLGILDYANGESENVLNVNESTVPINNGDDDSREVLNVQPTTQQNSVIKNIDNISQDLVSSQNNNLEIETSKKLANGESIAEQQDTNIENNVSSKTLSYNNETSVNVLSEEQVDHFNNEFNSILPEKDVINDDLLADIENLELEKTQKINISDVPDLDDIQLPNIKGINEEEIWKF